MNRRIILQPPIEVTAATTQEVRFAIPSTGAKSALFWVNVHKNTMTGGSASIDLIGASSLNLLDTGTSSSFWKTVLGSPISVGFGAVGAFSATTTTVPDFLRWKVTGNNNIVQFEIIAYLYDT